MNYMRLLKIQTHGKNQLKRHGIFQKFLRNISKIHQRRKEAQRDLATLSIIVPPLRVFMIPGSHILLGILANVTPWNLIPDEWIPIKALKKIREENTDFQLEKESKILTKILRRKKK
jgi:hypothetical protein